MGRRRTQTNTQEKKTTKLNKRLVRQTLRGYKGVNKVTRAEERAWAAQLTPEEARKVFIELNQAWEQTGARARRDWQAIDRWRTAESIKTNKPFVRLARRMKR